MMENLTIDFISLLLMQGLPNMGAAGAGAGTLDFLRNSQQVSLSLFMWMYRLVGMNVM